MKSIVNTGGPLDISFAFKMMMIDDEKEFSLEEVKLMNVDFVCVKRTGPINFIHVSDVENRLSIDETGLKISKRDWIPDLGKGIYCVKEEDDEGLNNLKDYISENEDSDYIIVVNGNYNGDYLECIYGVGHKGYIVLLNDVPVENISGIENVSVSDFLWYN